MSTNRIIDLTVKEAFPQPVAAAWHRALVTTSDTDRVKHLLACFEVLLRTLGSYFILDYLRGPRNQHVEELFAKLEKPSLGHWVGLIRHSLVAIREREGLDPFFPEAADWYFDKKGKPTEIARKIDGLVTLRNKESHDTPTMGGTATATRAAQVFAEMRAICSSLDWLRGYRLFRVQGLKRQRGRKPQYKGKAVFYTGEDALPIPVSLTVGTELLAEAMYVASPSGERVLEVTPFLRVEHDERLNQERLFLMRSTHRSKKVLLVNDVTGAEARVLIDSEVDELPFDDWVALEDHTMLVVEIAPPNDGLCAPDVGGIEGQRLGDRFDLLGTLGEGGMAIVHHVMDDFEGEEFALKLLRKDLSEDRVFQERFKREARTMKRIRHPNVLRVIDTGWLPDGRLWLTMPIVVGGNLRDRLKAERPDEAQARAWMTQMASAAVALHEREPPIVHRDIKPSNFLVDEDGSVLLTDFGIAFQENQARLTRTMEQMGSTAFMSPEQQAGSTVGPASDVYSLGVVYHEVLTGEDVVLKPGKGISGELGELVRAMTQREPAQRPTAAEVLAQLEGSLAEPAPVQESEPAPVAEDTSAASPVVEPEPSEAAEPEPADQARGLWAAMEMWLNSLVLFGVLNDTGREILRDRWFSEKPSSLRALGEQYGVSRERVRQIGNAARDNLGSLPPSVPARLERALSQLIDEAEEPTLERLAEVNDWFEGSASRPKALGELLKLLDLPFVIDGDGLVARVEVEPEEPEADDSSPIVAASADPVEAPQADRVLSEHCVHCGEKAHEVGGFCLHCGGAMVGGPLCGACERPMASPSAVYCVYCGVFNTTVE